MTCLKTSGVLTFVGTGRDTDHLGTELVVYEWASSLDGVLGDEQELVIPAAALTNAIEDALAHEGVRITRTPVTPTRILELLGRIPTS